MKRKFDSRQPGIGNQFTCTFVGQMANLPQRVIFRNQYAI